MSEAITDVDLDDTDMDEEDEEDEDEEEPEPAPKKGGKKKLCGFLSTTFIWMFYF